MVAFHILLSNRYAKDTSITLPKFPFDWKLMKLKDSAELGLSEDKLKEVCKEVESYLNIVLKVKDVLCSYKVRQFFNFKEIKEESQEGRPESIMRMHSSINISLNADYFSF